MPLIDVGDRQVAYVLEGAGEPVVISSPTWWPLDAWKLSGIPDLRDAYRVLAFNHRGIGQSGATDTPYIVHSMADDMVALLEALDLGPSHVVSFAIGGVVALKAAQRYPTAISSLVIAAAGAGAPAKGSTAREHEREVIRKDGGFRAHIRHHALNDDFAFSPASYARYPERAAALADALWDHQGPEEQYLKHAEARSGYSTLDGLDQITQPCLVLVGGEDNARRGISTPVQVARNLAVALKTDAYEVPGVRHMVFWEEPALAWGPVKTFLSQVGHSSQG